MNSDRLAEIAAAGPELLDDTDRAALDVLAGELAPRLAELLAPGMASMVIPAQAAAVLAASTPVPMRFALPYVGPPDFFASLDVLPGEDGSLTLALEFNSIRVWSGKLRGPLPAQPKETPA